MITIYKSDENGLLKTLDQPERGCWVDIENPTEEDKARMEMEFGILPEFVRASLDEEEASYVDYSEDDQQTLVIVDYPELEEGERKSVSSYITLPMSVIILKGMIVTVSLHANATISELIERRFGGFDTRYKTRLLLYIILIISQEYLAALRQINRMTSATEQKLYKHMRNENLIDMLVLDKGLIYFSTSLKSLRQTLERISRSRQIAMYEADRQLLDDVMIEVNQAIEMCEIYSDISARTADGFTNVINNNMNSIMKRLTVITLVLSIPNMVYGFYGMNVSGLPLAYAWWPFGLSIGLSLGAWLYFRISSGYRD